MNQPITSSASNPLTNPLLSRIKMPGETYSLPSGGVFYTNGELADNTDGNREVHVYPMTVIDEIVLKTPDLLFSGQAINEVFSRCIPQVLKPEQLLAKDVDFLLLCLRKVSYGDEVDLDANHQDCTAENPKRHTYRISVSNFIQASKHIDPTTVDQTYTIKLANEQVVKVIPIRYEDYIKTMQVQDQESEVSPQEQVRVFAEALVGVIVSVDEINDRDMIMEWLTQLPPKYITQMTDLMETGAQWGPEYRQEVMCKDCGQPMELLAPMNPLVFFFLTLKQGTPEDIQRMFDRLSNGVKQLIDGCISLSYFMRGGVPYEQMLNTTPGERERMNTFLNKRLEKESKKMYPNY